MVYTTMMIKTNEMSLVNKLLKDYGYESSIADLKLFDKYLINIFARLNVAPIVQLDIIERVNAFRYNNSK